MLVRSSVFVSLIILLEIGEVRASECGPIFVNLGTPAPVVFGEGIHRQEFKRLVKRDAPEIDSVILHSKDGVVPANKNAIGIFLPGTSGRSDSEFGVERSLAPMLNLLIKDFDVAAIGLQQPIYAKAGFHSVERIPFLEKYGTLQGNMDWLSKVLSYVDNQSTRTAGGGPRRPTFLFGRSTGAAELLQAYHEYAMGNSKFDQLAHVNAIFAMSVDGHTPEYVDKWHAAEVNFFTILHPEKGDHEVVMRGPKIFRDMTWQTQTIRSTAREHLPRIFVTIGMRDEFNPPSVLEGPIRDFIVAHPFAEVTVILHDGFHDMGRGIREVSEPMERMKVALRQVIHGQSTGQRVSVLYYPNELAVLGAVSKNPLESAELPHNYFSLPEVLKRLTNYRSDQ